MGRVAGAALAAALLALVIALALRRAPDPPTGTGDTGRHANENVIEPAPERLREEPDPVHAAPRETDDAGSPFADEDSYLRELERLNQTDQRRALELVRQGEQWYSASGVRAEARKAMGITLLVDLGQMAEARAQTRRFIADFPASTYRPLVQGVTGIHPRPSGPRGARE